MNFVTINYLWLKCYLKFYKIVPVEMGSYNILAIALNDIKLVLEKNIKVNHSFFETLITNSSSSAKIVQHILSLTDKFNAFTTSVGMVVLKDLECCACKFAVDSTSNNFIPPFMFFFVYILVNILYICYPQHINK